MGTMLCSSISRGRRTMPPTLWDSRAAKVTVGDFSTKGADMAMEPKAKRVPMRAGRETPMPMGYGAIWRRTTPNSEMSSRIWPVNWVGRGMSLVVRADLVEMARVLQATVARASRWAAWEQRASSLLLRAQWAMNWAA